jgi:uncharacterized membrane protein
MLWLHSTGDRLLRNEVGEVMIAIRKIPTAFFLPHWVDLGLSIFLWVVHIRSSKFSRRSTPLFAVVMRSESRILHVAR